MAGGVQIGKSIAVGNESMLRFRAKRLHRGVWGFSFGLCVGVEPHSKQ
jgi:hypothetical protein